jgi:alpha-beta hydrolase superfamily lysophospholipase
METMKPDETRKPDTVVLIHGLWMTPRSWEHWVDHYEARGLKVLTPAYPGFEIEVEALRENPDVIAAVTVPETVDHLAGVIQSLPRPPIIMGHSFGGALTQLLLARGLGCAGVAINSGLYATNVGRRLLIRGGNRVGQSIPQCRSSRSR